MASGSFCFAFTAIKGWIIQNFKMPVFFSRQPRNTEICTSQATYPCPPRYSVNWRRLSNWISFSNNRGKPYLNTYFKGVFWTLNIFHRLTESWLNQNSGAYNWGALGHNSNVAVYGFVSIKLNLCSLKVQIQVQIWGDIFKVRWDEDIGGSGAVFPDDLEDMIHAIAASVKNHSVVTRTWLNISHVPDILIEVSKQGIAVRDIATIIQANATSIPPLDRGACLL